MASLKNIKDRISSIKNTQKITKAMKMVAAAKVKKAENAVKASRPFTLALYNMFCWAYKQTTLENLGQVKTKENINNYSEFLSKRDIKTVGVVVFSSNKGLAGAYSANIIKTSLNLIEKLKKEGKDVIVYIIGQKAFPALRNAKERLGFEIKKTYISILDGINSSSAYTIASDLADDYVNHSIDSIELVTTRYKNMMTYSAETWQLLPVVADKKIKDFRNTELDNELNIKDEEKHIEPLSEFLPNLKAVLSKVVPMFITNVIYQALLEAQASELASRMTAMGAATNNAQEMISTLTVEYNKARQGKITQELTEIISGVGAVQ